MPERVAGTGCFQHGKAVIRSVEICISQLPVENREEYVNRMTEALVPCSTETVRG